MGSGYAVVEATVGEAGTVTDAHVVGSETGPFDPAATDAARGWRFEPARRGGKPVAARVYFVFAFRAPTT
jgi:TonB family protein